MTTKASYRKTSDRSPGLLSVQIIRPPACIRGPASVGSFMVYWLLIYYEGQYNHYLERFEDAEEEYK